MPTFEQIVERLDDAEVEVLRELDRRLAIAQALMHKYTPSPDVGPKDYAEMLLAFFEPVDDFLDSLDDDDDED